MKENILNTYELTAEENYNLIPQVLHKYGKINDCLKQNLKNGQIWLSTPDKFNDPFDCKAFLNYGETIEECRTNFDKFNSAFNIELPKLNLQIWEDLMKKPDDFNLMNTFSAIENFKEWIGISCFSENENSTLMWSHYADSHRGLMLDFKKDIKGFITKNILPVNYHKTYPIINVSDYSESEMISIAYQMICAKGIDWKYEKEWRVVNAGGNRLFDFNKDELVGVTFGLETSDSDKKEIYDIINKSDYKDIRFRQAEFLEREFVVEYKNYG